MTIETNNQVTLGGNPVRRGMTLQDPNLYGWWHAAILGHVGLCNFAKNIIYTSPWISNPKIAKKLQFCYVLFCVVCIYFIATINTLFHFV